MTLLLKIIRIYRLILEKNCLSTTFFRTAWAVTLFLGTRKTNLFFQYHFLILKVSLYLIRLWLSQFVILIKYLFHIYKIHLQTLGASNFRTVHLRNSRPRYSSPARSKILKLIKLQKQVLGPLGLKEPHLVTIWVRIFKKLHNTIY